MAVTISMQRRQAVDRRPDWNDADGGREMVPLDATAGTADGVAASRASPPTSLLPHGTAAADASVAAVLGQGMRPGAVWLSPL